MNEDPSERREREFDMITFLLAGVLSAIVLGAVGYGIVNSSKGVTTNIPSLTAGVENSQRQSFSNPGAATTGAK